MADPGNNVDKSNDAACAAASTKDIGGTYSPREENGDLVIPSAINGSGTVPVVDGVTLKTCDNVLLKDQADARSNGVWHVDDDGSASGSWFLQRVYNQGFPDYPTIAYVIGGTQKGTWFTPDDSSVEAPEQETRWECYYAAESTVVPTPRAAAASTGNIAATYDNGPQDDGQGATLTKASAGALPSQDGVSLSAGDYLLVRAQTDPKENGLYTVDVLGDGSTAFVLRRHHLQDRTASLEGALVYVEGGSTLAGTFHLQTTAAPTPDTDNIVWQRLLLLTGPALNVTGARNDTEQALANLLTALESLGAITDSTTPAP